MVSAVDNPDSVDLSIIIPTYNEADNIPVLVGRLYEILKDTNFEVIVVDDNSPDKTWQIVQSMATDYPGLKSIRRLDAKGLSSAVVTGMQESGGDVLAVMDADLQHDESILPDMLQTIIDEQLDICVGSREAPGGSYGEWSLKRRFISYGASLLAKFAVGDNIKDPMSGFFAIRRSYFEETISKINPSGFKILLEFAARGSNPKVKEIGYTFRTRVHGETKLNSSIAVEYLLALIDLKFGWLIPNRFVKFGMVGITGSMVNFFGFALLQALGFSLPAAIIIGIELAIIWTYVGNNFFTFTPFTYRGSKFFKGLAIYNIVSVYGLVIQFSVVDSLLSNWRFLAGNLITLYLVYLVGVLFGAVGNYFLHSNYTWQRLGFDFLKPARHGV